MRNVKWLAGFWLAGMMIVAHGCGGDSTGGSGGGSAGAAGGSAGSSAGSGGHAGGGGSGGGSGGAIGGAAGSTAGSGGTHAGGTGGTPSGGAGGGSSAGGTGGTAAKVVYADVMPIFAAHCSPCHTTNGADSGFHTLASSYTDAKKISGACPGKTEAECALIRIKNGSMPLGKGCSGNPTTDASKSACLTQAEQDKIQAWIDGGILQN